MRPTLLRAARARGFTIGKLGLGAVVVVLLLGAWAAVRSFQGPSGTGGPATADTFDAARLAFDITTTANGELEAKKQVELRNKLETAAKVVEVAKEGTRVSAGEVLVKLTSENIETQLQEESAKLETAKADKINAENAVRIQQNENDSLLRQSELKLTLARLDLSQWEEGELKQKRQDLRLALEKADRELKRLSEKAARSRDLNEKGFLSNDELQKDELALKEAEAAMEKARLAETTYESYQYPKDRATKESAMREADAEVERVKDKNGSQLANKQADLANKNQQLSVREKRVTKLQEQLEATTVRAPQDGLVVYGTSVERSRWGWDNEGPLAVGKDVRPNELLIILPDTTDMAASVKVHESIAGKVKPGQRATLKIDALGGRTVRGTVESIGVLAESGGFRDPNLREYTVKIDLDDSEAGAGLKPAMRCEGKIVMEQVSETLAVPVQGVFNEGMLRFVYVTEGPKYVRRPVQTGRLSDRYAEITLGLSEGDRILLRAPSPGEVLNRPWDKAQLKEMGFVLAEDGSVQPIAGTSTGSNMPANESAAGSSGPGRPGGRRTGPAPSAPAAEKPAGASAEGSEGTDAKPAGGATGATPRGPRPGGNGGGKSRPNPPAPSKGG